MAFQDRSPDSLYQRVSDFITPDEWPAIAPVVDDINRLKTERNALILAHNYMTPDIFSLVSDVTGDSLHLAIEARRTNANVIVQAGVYFMAETAKILCPDKTVLIPDTDAGCSLAASITAADVRLIRQTYPDLPIVCYVNTSAEVKAQCDITCTSANAIAIVEHIARAWNVAKVVMLPDRYLAQNVAANTDIEIVTWPGSCEVHETFTAADVADIRRAYPGVSVLAHPECPAEVLEVADFAGSTSALCRHVEQHRPARVVLLTECSMSDNVASRNPGVQMVRPCNLCPHMKRITLNNIRTCLTDMRHRVDVAEDVRTRAKSAIDAMLTAPHENLPGFRTRTPAIDISVVAGRCDSSQSGSSTARSHRPQEI